MNYLPSKLILPGVLFSISLEDKQLQLCKVSWHMSDHYSLGHLESC